MSLWSEADKNADGKLDWNEIRRLLQKINYELFNQAEMEAEKKL
jgi:hypothetical protein